MTFFDKNKKRIVMRSETRVNAGDQPMVIEKTVLHGTNKDPKLLAMAGVASSLANVDNVGKLVEDIDQYKEKMFQMKETLRKERGEGKILKRKHDDIRCQTTSQI